MEKTFCVITTEEASRIINHLETMFWIFETMVKVNELDNIEKFLLAKDGIHSILAGGCTRNRVMKGGEQKASVFGLA
jgi:hypothetical protein